MNEIGIGHNQPDMTKTIGEVAKDLSDWMAQHPIISNEDEAREAKLLIDRSKLGLQDLEAERDALVRPLNTQLREINSKYKTPRELLERVCDELRVRVTNFLTAEEAKRIAAAEAARLIAVEAERIARDAEEMERMAMSDASLGVADIDTLATIEHADQKFAEYQKAERQAQLAERETNVRLGGGFKRALSLRDVETIHVTDLLAAVDAMKDSARIVEAVVKSARSYKKVFGKYPPGIEISIERKA